MYSDSIGRFLQTDPIKFEAGDYNLYRYVVNNSVNRIDPYGLFLWPLTWPITLVGLNAANIHVVVDYHYSPCDAKIAEGPTVTGFGVTGSPFGINVGIGVTATASATADLIQDDCPSDCKLCRITVNVSAYKVYLLITASFFTSSVTWDGPCTKQ